MENFLQSVSIRKEEIKVPDWAKCMQRVVRVFAALKEAFKKSGRHMYSGTP